MASNPEIIQETFTEDIYRIPERVTIIIPGKWTDLKQSEIELLSNILNAVKLSLDKVQVLSMKHFDLNDLQANSPSALISFGSEIKQASGLYKVEQWNNVPIVQADSLNSFDAEKKSSLWGVLRQMFNLK